MKTFAACVAAILISGCAAAPRSDGGIVGSGNRIDCEDEVRKDGAHTPAPADCKRD